MQLPDDTLNLHKSTSLIGRLKVCARVKIWLPWFFIDGGANSDDSGMFFFIKSILDFWLAKIFEILLETKATDIQDFLNRKDIFMLHAWKSRNLEFSILPFLLLIWIEFEFEDKPIESPHMIRIRTFEKQQRLFSVQWAQIELEHARDDKFDKFHAKNFD